MRVHILGASGTYPAPGRPASGYLIEAGHTRVWCDAGPGTFTALLDRIDLDLVTGVVISHQHPDHCADLFAAFHALAFGPERREPLPLLAPQALIDRVAGFLGADTEHALWKVFSFEAVDDGDRRSLGEVSVEFVRSDHSVPTMAMRIGHDGRALAYSADTGPVGDWPRVARGADLFLCEASYQGRPGTHDYPHHLTAHEAGEIARSQGAERLVLTHIPPHMDPVVSVEEAEATFGRPVAVAVPGATWEV